MATKEQESAFIAASRKRVNELIKKQRFSGLDILAQELNEESKKEEEKKTEETVETVEPVVSNEVSQAEVKKSEEPEEKVQNEKKVPEEEVKEQPESKIEPANNEAEQPSETSVENTVNAEIENVNNDAQPVDNEETQEKDIKNIQLKRFAKYFTENGIDGSVRRSCSIDKSINFVLGIIAKQEGTTIKLFSDNIISDWYVYNKEWFETNGCSEMFEVDASFDTITKPCKKSLFAPKKIKTNFSDTTIISLSLNDAKKTQMLSMMTGVPIYQLFDTMVMDWVKRYRDILERKTYWPLIKMKLNL